MALLWMVSSPSPLSTLKPLPEKLLTFSRWKLRVSPVTGEEKVKEERAAGGSGLGVGVGEDGEEEVWEGIELGSL